MALKLITSCSIYYVYMSKYSIYIYFLNLIIASIIIMIINIMIIAIIIIIITILSPKAFKKTTNPATLRPKKSWGSRCNWGLMERCRAPNPFTINLGQFHR